MSGVDVLNLMDTLEISLTETGKYTTTTPRLIEARAAVAELIDAAQEAYELAISIEGMSKNNVENMALEVADRLGPALFRVAGNGWGKK